jgi:nicotinamide-nucleotide amidase
VEPSSENSGTLVFLVDECIAGSRSAPINSTQDVLKALAMTIAHQARRVAQLLAQTTQKVAFAESCTGGLVSGALTAVPGISAWHCGGVVVYRNETKHALLKISNRLLANPGPVSEPVVRRMAAGVLNLLPEATISLAVTGHLGPGAPPELDGLVFVGVGTIHAKSSLGKTKRPTSERTVTLRVTRLQLPVPGKRLARQRAVVEQALALLASTLESLA